MSLRRNQIFRIFVMMKEKFHRLFSVTMALLLLASTTAWTVEKHYCMGYLMDVSFYAEAEDCGMSMSTSSDDNSQISDQNSCCTDEIIIVEGQDDLKISFEEISFDQQLFLVAFTHSYLSLFEFPSERLLPDEHYPPPLLVKDIQLLDEVFII